MRVEAQSLPRRIRAVSPEAVALSGAESADEAVPDSVGLCRQVDARLGAGCVEQAKLDPRGRGREDREVHAPVLDAGAGILGRARLDQGASGSSRQMSSL